MNGPKSYTFQIQDFSEQAFDFLLSSSKSSKSVANIQICSSICKFILCNPCNLFDNSMSRQDLSILTNKSNTKKISDSSLGRYQSGQSPTEKCSIVKTPTPTQHNTTVGLTTKMTVHTPPHPPTETVQALLDELES